MLSTCNTTHILKIYHQTKTFPCCLTYILNFQHCDLEGIWFLLQVSGWFYGREVASKMNMITTNFTVTEFVFLGVSSQPKMQLILFIMFLFFYVLTVVGNIIIITLVLWAKSGGPVWVISFAKITQQWVVPNSITPKTACASKHRS